VTSLGICAPNIFDDDNELKKALLSRSLLLSLPFPVCVQWLSVGIWRTWCALRSRVDCGIRFSFGECSYSAANGNRIPFENLAKLLSLLVKLLAKESVRSVRMSKF